MIPGRDMAYVFVSGGITFASDEDIGGSYLRLVSKVRFNQKGKWLNAVSIWTRRFGYCRLHHPYRMCLKFLGTRFHCFRSFLLIWHPLFQIMRQQEQSGVPKTEATGKGPSSVVASSEAAFSDLIRMESWVNSRSTTRNRIWTIYTKHLQLTLFHARFDDNVPHKAQLKVRLVSDQEHCTVEFRDTPDTRVKKNLLSTLNFNWSSSSVDRQVSHLFNSFRKISEELNSLL